MRPSFSVCWHVWVSPLITFEQINRFLWNLVGWPCHCIWSRYRTLILYLHPFQHAWRLNFRRGYKTSATQCKAMEFCMLIDLQTTIKFLISHFCGGEETWMWRVVWSQKSYFVSWIFPLRQIKFGTVKVHGDMYKLYLNHLEWSVLKCKDFKIKL
jgi:hypothetical protein